MGKVTGFLELDREVESYRDVEIRIKDYDEISCFIKYVTELDYTKHVSVSSKITFKFMDLEEELF